MTETMERSTCSFDESELKGRPLKRYLAGLDDDQLWQRTRHGQVVTDLRLLLGTDNIESIAQRVGYTDSLALLGALRKWDETSLVDEVARQRELWVTGERTR